jgi:hypothetical protein
LSIDRKEKLDSIGFNWIGKRGHFVTNARAAGAKANTKDSVDRLEKPGFIWDARKFRWNVEWNEKFEELKRFCKKSGHCNVPCAYKPNPKLGHWCRRQRTQYKKGKLSVDRKDKLDSVGFTWFVLAYRQGGRFIPNMRAARAKAGTDFIRNRVEQQWVESLNRLVDFKETHGHWRVPPSYELDTSLAKWIETQRERRTTMKPERVEKLISIGFPWTATNAGENHCAEAKASKVMLSMLKSA